MANTKVSIMGDDTHRSVCSVCELGCLDGGKCRYETGA